MHRQKKSKNRKANFDFYNKFLNHIFHFKTFFIENYCNSLLLILLLLKRKKITAVKTSRKKNRTKNEDLISKD